MSRRRFKLPASQDPGSLTERLERLAKKKRVAYELILCRAISTYLAYTALQEQGYTIMLVAPDGTQTTVSLR